MAEAFLFTDDRDVVSCKYLEEVCKCRLVARSTMFGNVENLNNKFLDVKF